MRARIYKSFGMWVLRMPGESAGYYYDTFEYARSRFELYSRLRNN